MTVCESCRGAVLARYNPRQVIGLRIQRVITHVKLSVIRANSKRKRGAIPRSGVAARVANADAKRLRGFEFAI